MGGRFWKYFLPIIILFFANCGGSNSTEYNAQVIIDICGNAFPAAAFNLGEREHLFSNPGLFLGQPIDYFSEVLTVVEQATIKKRFIAGFQDLDAENQKQSTEQFQRWCESNKFIKQLNENLSSEESFFHLSRYPALTPIFNQILPERSRSANNVFSLEDFATLSSAEFHDMHQQFLKIISNLPRHEFEAAKEGVEHAISNADKS